MFEPIIAIYPSHDSSVCVRNSKGEYRVFELERLTKKRFYRFDNSKDYCKTYSLLKDVILKECGENSFSVCYHQSLPKEHIDCLRKLFDIKKFEFVGHHISHAASSFYQSPFDKALIISYDGGGYDGEDVEHRVSFFNIYLADSDIKLMHTINLDMGTCYGLLAIPISEIKNTADDWQDRFLSFAGKFMGLSAYGAVNDKWKKPLREYFERHKHHKPIKDLKKLGLDLGLNLGVNTISGQDSYDLAATAQSVFQEMAIQKMMPWIKKYKDLPVCLTGGCALNILVNQALHDRLNTPMYVPPNPNDCGLSFGMLALNTKPEKRPNLMYSGFPILDIDQLEDLAKKHNATVPSEDDICDLLRDGNIVAVMRGNSEHGPRALGNRSILCDPSFSNMKDTLNAKVKYREWFRPFAPIVRLEDVNKYFEFTGESKYMSYSPKVRGQYIKSIPAIVHVDGTSRVQTVREDDNPFIYNILSKFESKSGHKVLLNTSFNIKGRPILTTISDALEVLRTTELDYVLIEKYLFKKEQYG